MEETDNKFDTIQLITTINELIVQTEVTQYFKNTETSSIELEMIIPKLSNNNITRFEMTMNDKKVVSKLIEKEKAKEKYTDTIASGNYGFVSFSSKQETSIFLGNIPPNEEITLKSYFFSHLTTKDYSYQATFPVIFPGFVLGDPKNNNKVPQIYQYKKQIVKGKIFINTFSKLTRLVVEGAQNFTKIEKKYGNDGKSTEIEIYKDNFSEKDIPGIIIFRTEEINKDKLYYQYDPKKEKNYYILHKTINVPEFNLNNKDKVDEDEKINYNSLLKKDEKEETENDEVCYIFLLDQSGSMSGRRIEICSKALLLFLQSLTEGTYFQLIGFGSNYEYFSEEPLKYDKENVTKLMNIVKNLSADKGGTNLYPPLQNIYNNNIYEKFDMEKHIFLLTDGKTNDKEECLKLIGSYSDKFYFHSIGIGYCDKDLIERSALIGNGYSFFIDNLDNMNKVIISALENSQSNFKLECESVQSVIMEDKKKKNIKINDFFRHGMVSDHNLNEIKFKIKIGNNENEISFQNLNITRLPDGDELGKLIVDNYLSNNESLDFRTQIKLSKDYNILCQETAFYAEIQNEKQIKDEMKTITNKDQKPINNNNIIINNDNDMKSEEIKLTNFGYDNNDKNNLNDDNNETKEENKNKKGGFSNFISNIFFCKRPKNEIIKKKVFNYKKEEENYSKGNKRKMMLNSLGTKKCYCDMIENESCKIDYCIRKSIKINNCCSDNSIKFNKIESNFCLNSINLDLKEDKVKNEQNQENKVFNFDNIILSQEVIKGNWTKNSDIEILIKQENDLYEKIKKICEEKNIKEENCIITIFILHYIYKKKNEKVEELKFVINKAKKYIKEISNFEYEDIAKEIDTN